MTAATDESAVHLSRLLRGMEFAMLVTVGLDGGLRSRPMAVQEQDFTGDLWFFTHDNDPKIDEIERDRRVNVAFSSPEKQDYVSVSGRAFLVKDRVRMEQLWNPAYLAWFKEGLDDPHIALLKVEADQAEYWDSPASAVVHVWALAKRLVTGEEPTFGPKQHGKVQLPTSPGL